MQPEATATHYETLGVHQEAAAEEIRAAYRRQIRLVHPDVAGPDGAPRAAELSAAYAVLSKPDQRRAYDESLRSGRPGGPEGEEPVDPEPDWGAPSEWDETDAPVTPPGTEEELDDAVVEDAPQPATTDRPFGWVQQPDGSPAALQVRFPARHLVVIAAVGVLVVSSAVLVSWLGWTPGAFWDRQRTVTVAAVAAGLGALIGLSLHDRVPLPSIPAGVGSVALAVISEIGLEQPWLSLARVVYTFVLGVAFGMLVQERLSAQKRLNAVLPIKVLRRNNVFGSTPGETASDLLERSCAPLYSLPGLRMLRTPAADALFSHAFVCGTKVVFARALVADGGHFRWSGPTLFRDGPDGWPTEVLHGPYEDFLRRSPQSLGRQTEVRFWVLVFAPDSAEVTQTPDPLMPSVTAAVQGIDAIGRYLTTDNETALVDQHRVVAVANALYR